MNAFISLSCQTFSCHKLFSAVFWELEAADCGILLVQHSFLMRHRSHFLLVCTSCRVAVMTVDTSTAEWEISFSFLLRAIIYLAKVKTWPRARALALGYLILWCFSSLPQCSHSYTLPIWHLGTSLICYMLEGTMDTYLGSDTNFFQSEDQVLWL